MEGYDLFSDDLPSLGSSMLDGLAELGGAGQSADHSQYPATNQGPGQSQGARAPAGHSYYGSSYPQPSGVPHRSFIQFSHCCFMILQQCALMSKLCKISIMKNNINNKNQLFSPFLFSTISYKSFMVFFFSFSFLASPNDKCE